MFIVDPKTPEMSLWKALSLGTKEFFHLVAAIFEVMMAFSKMTETSLLKIYSKDT